MPQLCRSHRCIAEECNAYSKGSGVLCWNIKDCSKILRTTSRILQRLNGDLRIEWSFVVCRSHLPRPTRIGPRSEVSHPSAAPVKVAADVRPDSTLVETCACGLTLLESRALLAPVAMDVIFNYWLGHLGDQSDGITLCDRDDCQSYNWNKRNSFLTLGNLCVYVCLWSEGGGW